MCQITKLKSVEYARKATSGDSPNLRCFAVGVLLRVSGRLEIAAAGSAESHDFVVLPGAISKSHKPFFAVEVIVCLPTVQLIELSLSFGLMFFLNS